MEGSAKRVAGVGEEIIECVVVGELIEGGGVGVVGGVGEVGDKLGLSGGGVGKGCKSSDDIFHSYY